MTTTHDDTTPPGHFIPASTFTRDVVESEEYTRVGRQVAELLNSGIPTSVQRLDGQVHVLGTWAETGGVFSDVWKGEWVAGQKVHEQLIDH